MTSNFATGACVGLVFGAAVAYQIGYEKAERDLPHSQLIIEDSGIIEPLE